MKAIEDDYIMFTGAIDINELTEKPPVQDDRFETYVHKKAEMEECSECLGTGAEEYVMYKGKKMIVPCVFCNGTGLVKEKHYKNGIRIKYF